MYHLAAKQGEVSAQHGLGLLYYSGECVQQDYQEAAKWSKLAAEQGHADAQNTLGLLYYTGEGVTQDYQEAAKWYRLAAVQGNANAQYNLGNMYYIGQGLAQSQVAAYALYNLSAAYDPSSSNPSTTNCTALINAMPPKEIAVAQELIRELCKPGNLINALDQYIKAHLH